MAMNLTTDFSDLYGVDKLPALMAILEASKEMYPSMLDVLFTTIPLTTDIWQSTTLSGLRNPEIKPQGQPVTFQTIKPGYNVTGTVDTLAAGYSISKEAVDDGKYDLVNRATQSFPRGAFEVKEMAAADVFNDAFTTNGYDGVPLFSQSHPLENGMGVTGSNLADPSELSLTSFRELRNIMQDTLNEDGQRVRYSPDYLWFGQDLQDTGKILMQTEYSPEDANNAVNTVYNACRLLPGGFWIYLTSSTAWGLACDKSRTGLRHLSREPYNVDSDYNKKARAFETMSFERYGFVTGNWRGLAGNAGA